MKGKTCIALLNTGGRAARLARIELSLLAVMGFQQRPRKGSALNGLARKSMGAGFHGADGHRDICVATACEMRQQHLHRKGRCRSNHFRLKDRRALALVSAFLLSGDFYSSAHTLPRSGAA